MNIESSYCKYKEGEKNAPAESNSSDMASLLLFLQALIRRQDKMTGALEVSGESDLSAAWRCTKRERSNKNQISVKENYSIERTGITCYAEETWKIAECFIRP